MTVVVGGQWTQEDQHQIAHALDLPPEQVRVIYPAIGGAFGGREDMSVQIVLALAAWRQRGIAARSRSSGAGRNRSSATASATRCGCAASGAPRARASWSRPRCGSWPTAAPTATPPTRCWATPRLTCIGPYEIPNVKVDVDGVYTNNVPGGAFRGFGAPQAIFAAEMQMNKLAEALEMDPVELRLQQPAARGQPERRWARPLPGGVSLVEVTETVRAARPAGNADGHEAGASRSTHGRVSHTQRGLGLAVGLQERRLLLWLPGELLGQDRAAGRTEIEEAIVYIGSAEVGQGTHTVVCQMAAEALDLPLERVRLVASDTATSPGSSGSVSASRMTFMAGNAIRGAAEEAWQRWRDEERPAVAEYTYLAPKTTPFDPETGHGMPNFAYGYVAEAVEVEVDTETGELRVLRVVCADDVGKAINPQQVEGQIEGGVVQALGWATCENFITADGQRADPEPEHLPDPHHRRHAGAGRFDHRRAARSARALGRARDGRDALPAAGAGAGRRHPRRDRRLVRRAAADAGAGVAGVGIWELVDFGWGHEDFGPRHWTKW